MRDDHGNLQQPLPAWPAIGQGHMLPALLDLADDALGPWLALAELEQRYSSKLP
jgi:hypothetical protein